MHRKARGVFKDRAVSWAKTEDLGRKKATTKFQNTGQGWGTEIFYQQWGAEEVGEARFCSVKEGQKF
jgi:hypothetical protein